MNFQELIREGEPIEVIFVSFDQCPEDMMAYMRECHGDWLAVQHGTVLARYSHPFIYDALDLDIIYFK